MNPEYKNLTKIPYFRRVVLQNFPFIEEDFDALTDYGLLCKVVEYLNKVIKQQNLVNDNTDALYQAYTTLQDYVNNYFDNLDVQEEINNKLDEMVEDGTLQEIIADYLNSKAVFGFDTVADMKNATNLINGSYAKTLGYYALNDGGSATYKIREVTNLDTVDNSTIIALQDENLVAELIINDIMNVHQFGAKGDGVTDDTNFIQIAIDSCNYVYFNNKTYLLTDTLNLKSNINLIGNNTTLQTSTANLNCFTASNLSNISIKCFNINGFKRSSNINNCSNVNISNLIISTTEWGVWLSLCNKFIIENITFNQLRTTSYSNKDGIHINGGKNGVIRNIYGTTDDDMIALNADETTTTYGEISHILIDNVVTINSQEHGLENATYQGIKLLSNGSLIDDITIQNCKIASDYAECMIITGDSNANIGNVYINNCEFIKKHSRTNHIIELATPYNSLKISNCKLVNKISTSGAFIHESNNYARKNTIIEKIELIDESESERGFIALTNGSKDNLIIQDIECTQNHVFQLITIKENIKNVIINNIFTKNQRHILAIQTDAIVNKINLSDISSVDGTSVISIKGQVSNLNMNNIITDNTTYVCNIETEQTALIATASNINSSTINTINTSDPDNIRLKSGFIAEFIPTSARGGDTFIYRNSSVFTPKIYSNNEWINY